MSGLFSPRVAVVDSGWNPKADSTIVEACVRVLPCGTVETVPVQAIRDLSGHGTITAQIIMQLNPLARVVPVQVLDWRLDATVDQLAAAMEWCAEQRIDIACFPLATDVEAHGERLAQPLDAMHTSGVVVVAAASRSTGRGYPAQDARILGVCVAECETGHRVELTSDPAIEYRVTLRSNAYANIFRLSGYQMRSSSFAAAQLAGDVAQMMTSMGRRLSHTEVRRMLYEQYGGSQ